MSGLVIPGLQVPRQRRRRVSHHFERRHRPQKGNIVPYDHGAIPRLKNFVPCS